MPEGHLIHHLAHQHARALEGAPVHVSSPQGRFTREARAVDGLVLTRVEPYGKHLAYRFANDALVHVHLGKQGTALLRPAASPPIPQARVRFTGPHDAVEVIAPRLCELGDEALWARVVSRLGPDPLRADVDEAGAKARLRLSGSAIGAVLLDQSVVAGVGNVLRAEALHAARIHPGRPARSLDDDEVERLWRALTQLMRQGADVGRVLPYLAAGQDAFAVDEAETRAVYGRVRCRICGGDVARAPVGGRTAWFCPRCQPAGGPARAERGTDGT